MSDFNTRNVDELMAAILFLIISYSLSFFALVWLYKTRNHPYYEMKR